MKFWPHLTTLTAALGFAAAAPAQTIYKYQSSDGRTVYSDKVPHGAKVQKELEPDSALSIVAPPGALARAERTTEPAPARIARRDEFWRERDQARADLETARAAKANGEEPLPGERTGNARGGSRLNDAYWARQDRLSRDVERAQRRLELAERNLREAGS